MAEPITIMDPLPGTRFNNDLVIINRVFIALAKNKGYCPCAIYKDDDHKCQCLDYRISRLCRCGLYVKDE